VFQITWARLGDTSRPYTVLTVGDTDITTDTRITLDRHDRKDVSNQTIIITITAVEESSAYRNISKKPAVKICVGQAGGGTTETKAVESVQARLPHNLAVGTEYTECQAFYPVVRIGSPPPPHTQESVALPLWVQGGRLTR
jgi:hypothetical protein